MEPATEIALLLCFGAEPELLNPDMPWWLNVATYRFQVEGFAVSFTVEPGYFRVHLDVRRDGLRLFGFDAEWIAELRIIDEADVDAIVVVMDVNSWLRLQLRPTFEVIHGFKPASSYGRSPDDDFRL